LFLLPVFWQNLRQYSAYQSGIIMLPWAISSAIGMAGVALVVTRVSPRLLIAVGILASAIGMVMMSHVTYLTGPEHLFVPQVLIGIGIGLLMVPLMTVSLNGLTGIELGDGSGLFNMARQLGGSIGIAILTSFINRHIVFHQAALAEHVNVYSSETLSRFTMLQQFFASKGAALADATQQALAALNLTITSQAVLLAYEDVFLLVAIIYAVTLPLILLIRKPRLGDAPETMPLP
jgi:DHA2 family multidrug resistance protein